MKLFTLFLYLALASLSHAEVLRLSLVEQKPSDKTEDMTYMDGEEPDTLHINKRVIISDADIKHAQVSISRGSPSINVELTDKGAKKLTAATEKMQHGVDRMAIILDGNLITAPTVQSTIGKMFQITGFSDMEIHQVENIARRMSGLEAFPEAESKP